MGRAEGTVSQREIPAGNWAAHQLRLVYDDTKELFSSRLSHRDNTKFQSQYSLQFMPRSSRPAVLNSRSSSRSSSSTGHKKNAVQSAMRDDKTREDNFNRAYGTIKEAICPENTQSHDFRDWNIPSRFIREKLDKKENQQTGNEIRELSSSLGKVRVNMDSSYDSISSDVLPPSPILSERSSRNSQVSSHSDKKITNDTTCKLPAVCKFLNKTEVRPHTQPELKRSSSSDCRIRTTTADVKNDSRRRKGEKYASHKDSKDTTEIQETKTTGNKVDNNRKKTADAMRMAELHYKIDCVLKRALFPDIYHTVKKRLINLPTAEQERILKFFKKKAEAITEVRRSEKLKELLSFLMKGKQFGMEKSPVKIKENDLNNLRYIRLLSPRRREKRFELTTWHHQPIYKPEAECMENKTSIFLNACHVAPTHAY